MENDLKSRKFIVQQEVLVLGAAAYFLQAFMPGLPKASFMEFIIFLGSVGGLYSLVNYFQKRLEAGKDAANGGGQ
jgi:hypothetical protein